MHEGAQRDDEHAVDETGNRPETDDAGGQTPQDDAEEPTCAICGQPIDIDDIECPHCGASLVAG